MPVERTMMEHGRVFFFKMTDPWTAEQIVNELGDDEDLLNRSHAHVHTLVDVTDSRQLPKGILRLRSRPAAFHEMAGYVVVVGASSVMKAMGVSSPNSPAIEGWSTSIR